MTLFILILFSIVVSVMVACAQVLDFPFNQTYEPLWGFNHLTVLEQGKEVQLLLDASSGAGFRSKSAYCNGSFGIRMKTSDSRSKGVITSFYLISHHINSEGGHDELDFEFLDTNGTLQTNVFANDKGHREELVDLGFDPSIDFHTYLILWSSQKVEFFVDGRSVRVFPNDGREDFFKKPMYVEASIWNGTWAGEVDWTKAPFIGLYQNFTVDGLKTNNTLQCDSLPEHSYLAKRPRKVLNIPT